MPEGPSIVLLREATEQFIGRRILAVEGNSKQPIQRLTHRVVRGVLSWGKHYLIDLGSSWIRIHFGLFGSWRVDTDDDPRTPRLRIRFSKGQSLGFYACSVHVFEGSVTASYDWTTDVMHPEWDAKAARAKLRKMPDALVADVLLDQQIFSGVGNIIKNEVLHRIRVHPRSAVGALPARKLGQLVEQARTYSFDFLEWKRAFVLRRQWQVHAKTICPRDGTRLSYAKHLGTRKRRAFWCEACQHLYVFA
jgi:endonuclease-8